MEKRPPGRRSAGMLHSPRARDRDGPGMPATPPLRREAPEPNAAPRVSRHPSPRVLMGEVTGPRGQQVGEFREAFRAFMVAQHLRPTEWAKEAGVPVGEILAYLTGQQRFFSPGVAERLAGAAGVPLDVMFGPE